MGVWHTHREPCLSRQPGVHSIASVGNSQTPPISLRSHRRRPYGHFRCWVRVKGSAGELREGESGWSGSGWSCFGQTHSGGASEEKRVLKNHHPLKPALRTTYVVVQAVKRSSFWVLELWSRSFAGWKSEGRGDGVRVSVINIQTVLAYCNYLGGDQVELDWKTSLRVIGQPGRDFQQAEGIHRQACWSFPHRAHLLGRGYSFKKRRIWRRRKKATWTENSGLLGCQLQSAIIHFSPLNLLSVCVGILHPAYLLFDRIFIHSACRSLDFVHILRTVLRDIPLISGSYKVYSFSAVREIIIDQL